MARVLVVGFTGYEGVVCVEWFAGRAPPNAADFDIVLVNGTALAAVMRRERDSNFRVAFSRVKQWQAWMSGLRERLRKLLKSKGTVLAVVDTLTVAVGLKDQPPVQGYPVMVSSTDWIPIPIDLKAEQGTTLQIKDAEFARYMNTVESWNFLFAVDEGNSEHKVDELRDEHDFDHIEVELHPIAVNRQELPIAATVNYAVHETTGRAWTAVPYAYSGKLHLLPPPTAVPLEEGLRVLLEDFCGVEPRTPAPAWVAAFPLVGSRDLDAAISEKEEAIGAIEADLAPLLEEKRRRQDFKALLYETGIGPLQDLVEAAFKELGLTTKPSKVSDEFVVEHEGREFLAEVKGNEKSAKLKDLRQLIDYQLEHEQKHGSPIKSTLIVNAWRSLPPDKRRQQDTAIFPDNVVKRARDNNIALVDTVDLYGALNSFWLDQTDGKTIFEVLFNSRGVVTLSP